MYLVSPFIENGTLMEYIAAHPDADRPRFVRTLGQRDEGCALRFFTALRDGGRAGLPARHADHPCRCQSEQYPCLSGPSRFDMRLWSREMDAFDNCIAIQGCRDRPLAKSGTLGRRAEVLCERRLRIWNNNR